MITLGEHATRLLRHPYEFNNGRAPTVRERLIADKKEIARLIKKGLTTKDVSKHYGINNATVQCYIREAIGDTLMEQLKGNAKKLRGRK